MTFLVALPTFHAAIAPLVHIGALRSGYIMYIMRRFELPRYFDLINQYNITDLIVVPPILHALITSTHPSRETALRKLKNVVCGAAPLSRDIQAKATRHLAPGVPLTQGWGMTESCCASMMFPYPECDETGSVGRLVPNMEAKYVLKIFYLKLTKMKLSINMSIIGSLMRMEDRYPPQTHQANSSSVGPQSHQGTSTIMLRTTSPLTQMGGSEQVMWPCTTRTRGNGTLSIARRI